MDWATGLLWAVIIVGAPLLKIYLERVIGESVRAEFEKEIEAVRAEHKRSLSLLEAEVRAREGDVAALRSGVLDASTKRRTALLDRRIKAIDELWASFRSQKRAAVVVGFLATLNLEAIEKMEDKAKRGQLFSTFALDPTEFVKGHIPGDAAQPFVSPMAWAYFSAYQTLTSVAVSYAYCVKTDTFPEFFDKPKIINLFNEVLPERAKDIEKSGWSTVFRFMDEIEAKLLVEISRMLDGKEDDEAHVNRADEILRRARETTTSKSMPTLSN